MKVKKIKMLACNKRFKIKPNLFKVLYYIENTSNKFSSTDLAQVFGVDPKAIRYCINELHAFNAS